MTPTKGRGICMDVRVGDKLEFVISTGGVDTEKITLTLDSKDGRKARFRIEADERIRIVRPAKQAALT